MDSFWSTILGVPLGIIASLIAWWILFHFIVPKIEFSPHISKYFFDYSGLRYRIKIRNVGLRDIIDLEVIPILKIKGLNQRLPKNWLLTTINTSSPNHKTTHITRGGDRIFSLHPEQTSEFSQNIFPDSIRNKYIDGSLTLEDLLRIGEVSKLIVYVFGYDSFSGTRKLFISKQYRLTDIRNGLFDYDHTMDKSGLQIVEDK